MIPIKSALMLGVLAVAVIVVLALLLIAQLKKDKFDLRWLILDDRLKHPSVHKMGQLAALVVSTWGFVFLTVHDKLSEVYFTTYMGIWAATEVANKLVSKKDDGSNQTTTKPGDDSLLGK